MPDAGYVAQVTAYGATGCSGGFQSQLVPVTVANVAGLVLSPDPYTVTVAPGESAWSDPVALPFARGKSDLRGRKLAVSFHVDGQSGPMTWHAKALQSSYVTLPGAGSKGADESEAAFPFARSEEHTSELQSH